MDKTVYIRVWEGRFFVYAGNEPAFETEDHDEIFRLTSLLKRLDVSYTIETRDKLPERSPPIYDVSDW